MVDHKRVGADKADGDSLAQPALWHSPSLPVAPVLLKHEPDVVEFERTPTDASLWSPLVGHHESQSLDIEAKGSFDIRDAEEGNCLFDVHSMRSFRGHSG